MSSLFMFNIVRISIRQCNNFLMDTTLLSKSFRINAKTCQLFRFFLLCSSVFILQLHLVALHSISFYLHHFSFELQSSWSTWFGLTEFWNDSTQTQLLYSSPVKKLQCVSRVNNNNSNNNCSLIVFVVITDGDDNGDGWTNSNQTTK